MLGKNGLMSIRIRIVLGIVMFILVMSGIVWAQEGVQTKPPGFFEIWLLPRVWISAIFSLLGLVLLSKIVGKEESKKHSIGGYLFCVCGFMGVAIGEFCPRHGGASQSDVYHFKAIPVLECWAGNPDFLYLAVCFGCGLEYRGK